MVLELHIWGPAFGLPSIDPQCLATIAYFSLALSRNKNKNGDGADEWVLVADSDTGAVPTNELPALWTGSRWISRFRNIIDFLKQYSGGEWDLDQWMDDKERAECTAFSSFIDLHGQPLIDLSLYVSSQNYSSATMPAYGSILQWPNQWIIPPRVRTQAKSRTEHLGLSSLDLDDAEKPTQRQQDGRQLPTASSLIPRSLAKKPRETVSGLLSKTASQSRIRLEGITESFIMPLEDLVSQRRNGGYLLSEDNVSSLDCLALGYLSLAVIPELQFSWLRESIKDKTPGLMKYTERLRAQCFPGGSVDVSVALEGSRASSGVSSSSSLPWQAPERISLGGIGLRALEGVADTIPVVRDIRAGSRIQRFSRDMAVDEERAAVMKVVKVQRRELYTSAATVLAGIGLLAWYVRSASRPSG